MQKVKPSEALAANRDTIRRLAAAHRMTNPRVFGSVAAGKDNLSSDLDILVDTLPNASLFNLGGLHVALEEALKVKIDVMTPKCLPSHIRAEVEEMAVPV